MARITGEITIARPIDVVFDFVTDERNEPTYNPDLLSSEKVTAGPIRLGTKFTAVHKARRRPIDMVIEVTEYDRPRRMGSTTATPAGEVRGGLTFEEVEGGTRLRWLWEMRPRGVARFLGPLVRLVGNRQERACWAGLKRYMESVPQSSR
ncbi:MAG: SRPBCC family protein [Blastococcus sp.]